MICFERTGKVYLDGRQVLQDATSYMQPGEMTFLAGHSGAGKSIFPKLICGVEWPSVGKIWFSGYDITYLKNREVPFLRRQTSMIPQDHHPLIDCTVHGSAVIPLIIAGASGGDIRRWMPVMLDKVGLLDEAKSSPTQLSGGEQQRIGITRTVVNKLAVLLANEPTGNLNDALSEGTLCLFKEFNRVGVTILTAAHDVNLISRRSYHILALSDSHLHGGVDHE